MAEELDWRTRLQAEFVNHPQKAHRGLTATKSLDAALVELASLGFPLHIEEGPAPVEPEKWPRYVFHLRQEPKVCRCEEDYKELGPDWFFSIDEARQAAGEAKQWQRGGVFTKSLPARVDQMSQAVESLRPKQSRNARAAALRPANYQVPAVLKPNGLSKED